MSKFKFDEDKILKEVYDYVAATYEGHEIDLIRNLMIIQSPFV